MGFLREQDGNLLRVFFLPLTHLSSDSKDENIEKRKLYRGARRKNTIRASEFISRAPSNHLNWVLPLSDISCGKEKYEIIIRMALQYFGDVVK